MVPGTSSICEWLPAPCSGTTSEPNRKQKCLATTQLSARSSLPKSCRATCASRRVCSAVARHLNRRAEDDVSLRAPAAIPAMSAKAPEGALSNFSTDLMWEMYLVKESPFRKKKTRACSAGFVGGQGGIGLGNRGTLLPPVNGHIAYTSDSHRKHGRRP